MKQTQIVVPKPFLYDAYAMECSNEIPTAALDTVVVDVPYDFEISSYINSGYKTFNVRYSYRGAMHSLSYNSYYLDTYATHHGSNAKSQLVINYIAKAIVDDHFSGMDSYVKDGVLQYIRGVLLSFDMPDASVQGDDNVSILAKSLPGMEQQIMCPRCDFGNSMYHIVQHLNDHHKWSRDKIADWLDDLADRGMINIDFKEPE